MSSSFTPSLEHRLLEFLAGKKYRPLKQHELARAMQLNGSNRSRLREVLRKLEKDGKIIRLRKNRYALPDSGVQVPGTLRVHPKGFAFLIPDERTAENEDIYIPADNLGTALDGDRVMASVIRLPDRKPGKGRRDPNAGMPRTEGRILKVLEHKNINLVGLLKKGPYYCYVIPDNPRILTDIQLAEGRDAVPVPPENHKVLVKLLPWRDARKPLRGEIVEDLGPADDPGVDMISIIRDLGLSETFPEPVLEDARNIAARLDAEAPLVGRRDLRGLLTLTIDPEDARDFDDAVSLEMMPGGKCRLGVHIADVSHFVKAGGPVDNEARYRATSVYLVDRVITMLPRDLTTDICSLVEGDDRLTHSVIMEFNSHGEMLRYETTPSIIRSRARLNYDQVQAFLDKKEHHGIPGEVQETLTHMHSLSRRLRGRRLAEGSLDLDMPEVRCRLDNQGQAVGFTLRSSSDAYQLIEEFMLRANCAVAEKIYSADVPSLYRIHLAPDEQQWGQMMEDLLALGINKVVLTKDQVRDILAAYAEHPMRHACYLAVLRNLKRAEYAAKPAEHFGLGFQLYTHFTSPIRRYPDLVIHRILKAIEAGSKPPYPAADLESMASHCSLMQQKADEAEQLSVETKRIDFYYRQLLKHSIEPMTARITGIKPKGLLVEVEDSLQRGMVPFSAMNDDYYRVSQDRSRAVGQRQNNTFKVGQSLRVELYRVDPSRRMIDFQLSRQDSQRIR